MSGIFTQLGVAKEVRSSVPVTTSGVASAGNPNTVLFTHGSAHGLRQGDVVTLSGYTPSGYNGTWVVNTVPSTTTWTIQTGTTLLTNVTVHGTIAATAYGTSTTPVRFYEFVNESIDIDRGLIESSSVRSSSRVNRNNRFATYVKSINGDLTLEVLSNGFGYWLKSMLGKVVTAGPTDSAYTHTATLGDPRGESFTIQKLATPTQGGGNPPFTGAGFPFTYNGMKVKSWELTNDVGGILMLKLSFAGRNVDLSVPLAVASYPGTPELFTFAGGSITVDGLAVANIRKVTISGDNKLALDRYGIGPTTLRSEPIVAGIAEFKATMSIEFNELTLYNKFMASTASGTLANLQMRWTAPTLIGATTFPSITVNMPTARVDGDTPNVNGPDLIMLDVPFQALDSNTGNDAINIVYITTEATVT